MSNQGSIAPAGRVSLRVLRTSYMQTAPTQLRKYWKYANPLAAEDEEVVRWRLRNLPGLLRGARRIWLARKLGIGHVYGALYLTVLRRSGLVQHYGLASLRVVTNAGVGAIVDAFQNLIELENFKYHGIGTSSVAEASSDTALGSELTTAYNPDNTRATGSLAEGASANIFRTIGTNTLDGAATITEHGIFSQAATGGGILLDRSVFGGIALSSGDSLQSTYELTFPSGS